MGNWFVHFMEYPSRDFPFVDKGGTIEIEEPYRIGSSLVFRLPFGTKALVVGRWTESLEEEEALTRALGAKQIPDWRTLWEGRPE